jgi:hypothetical protein
MGVCAELLEMEMPELAAEVANHASFGGAA